MTVAVSERQAHKIKSACQDFLENKSVTILDLAKVVGLLVASAPGWLMTLYITKELIMKNQQI